MATLTRDETSAALSGLAPDVAEAAALVIEASRLAGWPVVIGRLGARRTFEDQRRLYAQGRTAPGPIVTSTMQSKHLSGRAFDLDLLGWPRSAGMPLWRVLGQWWKSAGGRWGGDWGDYGHFEL